MGTLIHFGSPVGVIYEPDAPEDEDRPDKDPVGHVTDLDSATRKRKFWKFGK